MCTAGKQLCVCGWFRSDYDLNIADRGPYVRQFIFWEIAEA